MDSPGFLRLVWRRGGHHRRRLVSERWAWRTATPWSGRSRTSGYR